MKANNARLIADLQAVAIAVRLVGLDGLRSGQVTFPARVADSIPDRTLGTKRSGVNP